jgi:hypothetical protein
MGRERTYGNVSESVRACVRVPKEQMFATSVCSPSLAFCGLTFSRYQLIERDLRQWRTERRGGGGGCGCSTPPPPEFRSLDKAEPNFQFRGKYIRNNLIRIRVSLICKLSGTPN